MTGPALGVQIVMLTDDQLDREIAETTEQVCCPNLLTASRSLCGCGGRAAEYLARLHAEARRRALDANGAA